MVKFNQGSSYENIGSTRVPDAVYKVSRSSASSFRKRNFLMVFTIYGHGVRTGRLWSDWAGAQPDLSLLWTHVPFCWFCQVSNTFCKLDIKKKNSRLKTKTNMGMQTPCRHRAITQASLSLRYWLYWCADNVPFHYMARFSPDFCLMGEFFGVTNKWNHQF